MNETLRRTPLHGWHEEAGARLVPFAGWEMPVQFSGVLDEHHAVRTAAGLFDVSHMGELEVTGPGALDFLQRMTPNNVARLDLGQAHYSALLQDDGTYIDDLLVYRQGEARFLLVVNAANTARDIEWLEAHMPPEGVALRDRSDELALLALQGPRAADILARVAPEEAVELGYYRFTECNVGETQALVSRTGYTGEDGFELYVSAGEAEALWRRLMDEGAELGLQPVGLGARDTLRLEAGMLLSGQDMDSSSTPLEVGMSWVVKFKKGDFVGREALLRQRDEGPPRCMIGFELDGRRPARPGSEVLDGGEVVGAVTSGTWSPSLERPIGLALVQSTGLERSWAPGEDVMISVRGKNCSGVIVELPFVRRG